MCPSCDAQIRDTSNINAYDVLKERVEALSEELGNSETEKENLSQQVKTLDEHQTSLKLLLEERENSLHKTEAKVSLDRVQLQSTATSKELPT